MLKTPRVLSMIPRRWRVTENATGPGGSYTLSDGKVTVNAYNVDSVEPRMFARLLRACTANSTILSTAGMYPTALGAKTTGDGLLEFPVEFNFLGRPNANGVVYPPITEIGPSVAEFAKRVLAEGQLKGVIDHPQLFDFNAPVKLTDTLDFDFRHPGLDQIMGEAKLDLSNIVSQPGPQFGIRGYANGAEFSVESINLGDGCLGFTPSRDMLAFVAEQPATLPLLTEFGVEHSHPILSIPLSNVKVARWTDRFATPTNQQHMAKHLPLLQQIVEVSDPVNENPYLNQAAINILAKQGIIPEQVVDENLVIGYDLRITDSGELEIIAVPTTDGKPRKLLRMRRSGGTEAEWEAYGIGDFDMPSFFEPIFEDGLPGLPYIPDWPHYREGNREYYPVIRIDSMSQLSEGVNPSALYYKPELLTGMTVERLNAKPEDFVVQPRTQHVNTCPILMPIDLPKLDPTNPAGVYMRTWLDQVTTEADDLKRHLDAAQNPDGVIEWSGDLPVKLHVSIPAGSKAGDDFTISDGDGNVLLTQRLPEVDPDKPTETVGHIEVDFESLGQYAEYMRNWAARQGESDT